MKHVSEHEIIHRIRFENPWWDDPHEIEPSKKAMRRRAYLDSLRALVKQRDPRRAVILMGPRRVGKTVLLHQVIQDMIDSGTEPESICYLDLQTPTYSGMSLEKLLSLGQSAAGIDRQKPFVMCFDEVQYLRDWEVHLKNAVDTFGNVKFVVSGSAAAALRMKSVESGAGRFTDFLLPPVTFLEYLILIGLPYESIVRMGQRANGENYIEWDDLDQLNAHFINYLNFGGYPEAIMSPAVQSDPGRFIRSDIIEKVLTRDLPSIYGIHDIAELNRLFTMLAYNTAQEVSIDNLSKGSGVAKPTIKKYIEYLEAAFLIKVIHRVDNNAKRFKKANFFKVYLTNPCMRGALFAPLDSDSEHIGSLVETAVFSQWLHSETQLHYGRWAVSRQLNAEVDLIQLSPADLKPTLAVEIKWSDRPLTDSSELKSLSRFLQDNPACTAFVTTRSVTGSKNMEGRVILFLPSAAYCYYVGWAMLKKRLGGLDGLHVGSSDDPA